MKHYKYLMQHVLLGKDRKRGVALLFVLGLLAMVVSLAVSFAGLMRTERVLAGNTVEVVKARQLALSALDMVVYDISRSTGWSGTNVIPDTPWTSDLGFMVAAGTTNNPLSGHFHKGQDAIGGSLQHFPDAITGVDGNLTEAFYRDDTPYYTIKNTDNEVIGIFSFVALDQSGGLDFNAAGPVLFSDTASATNTYNPDERNSAANLYLEQLPGIDGSSSNSVLDALLVKSKWRPFISLWDYRLRNGSTISGEARSYATSRKINIQGVDPEWTIESGVWNTFTKYPQTWYRKPVAGGSAFNQRMNLLEINDLPDADILGTADGNEAKREYDALYVRWVQEGWEDAFTGRHIDGAFTLDWTNAGYNRDLFTAVVDYVDDDFLPYSGVPFDDDYTSTHGLGAGVTEPLPLITQFVWDTDAKFQGKNSGGTNIYKLSMELTVELWFPYAAVTNYSDYDFELSQTWGIGFNGWNLKKDGTPAEKALLDDLNKAAFPKLLNGVRIGQGHGKFSQPRWTYRRDNANPGTVITPPPFGGGWYMYGSIPSNQLATIKYVAPDTGNNFLTAQEITNFNKSAATQFTFSIWDIHPTRQDIPVNRASWVKHSATDAAFPGNDPVFFKPGQKHSFSLRAQNPIRTKNGSWFMKADPNDLGRHDKHGVNAQPNSWGNWAENVLPFFPKVFKNGNIKNVAELLFVGRGQSAKMQPFWALYDRSGDDPAVPSSAHAHDRNTSAFFINLDAFMIGTNEFKRGLVNMNTLEPDVLSAALYNDKHSKYFALNNEAGDKVEVLRWGDAFSATPDDPTAGTCAGIARELIQRGPYRSKSEFAAQLIDICDIDELGRTRIEGVKNKSYREAILVNTLDMVDFTGNTILVGLHVENVRDLDKNGIYNPQIDIKVSERDLVAQIWRDLTHQNTELVSIFWPEITD